MRIAQALAQSWPSFSCEFYAPYSEDGVPALLETIQRLRRLNPLFVSVTCSTGARRRRRTLEIVTRIKGELGIEAMPHLTCLGTARDELHARLHAFAANGIENVLA
ncbi:MAG TPA: methylenetetrahydrofolate reductase, partial [Chloroflexota bacterium]